MDASLHVVRLRRDGYTYERIALYLDRKGVRPPRAERWSAAGVRNLWLRESAALIEKR